MKRLISMILLSVMIFIPSNIALAQNQDTKLSNLINSNHMTMITRDQIPDGVKPLVVNSYDELEEITTTNNNYKQNTGKTVSKNNGIVLNSYFPPKSKTDDYTLYCEFPVANFHSLVTYTYSWYDNGNYTVISRIDDKKLQFLQQINCTFDKEAYTAEIASDQRSINVYVRGNLYQYLYFAGDGNYYKSLAARINTNYVITP